MRAGVAHRLQQRLLWRGEVGGVSRVRLVDGDDEGLAYQFAIPQLLHELFIDALLRPRGLLAKSGADGHRALRLQQAGGWRGKGGQRRRWRHRLEVGS